MSGFHSKVSTAPCKRCEWCLWNTGMDFQSALAVRGRSKAKLFRELDPYLLHCCCPFPDFQQSYSVPVVMHARIAGILWLEQGSTEVYPDDIPVTKNCIWHKTIGKAIYNDSNHYYLVSSLQDYLSKLTRWEMRRKEFEVRRHEVYSISQTYQTRLRLQL